MLCRVLVLRRIAAAHLAAYHALPQVNPSVSQFDALAAHSRGLFHMLNLIQVRALFHMFPLKLGQGAVDLVDGNRPFAHSRSHAFHIPRANVAHRKHARKARFQHLW